ncbi:putative acyl--CoA ligase YhfT [Clostridium saccharobutylicum]|uniref:AMP-binding protein n=1 Tax=Clostridium saccharobutylicum TaxID=169679 RepID=UPI000983936C|nr:AMP-binding protein [Clostridium saccharobutylicum]AQS10722.1 putative acyl--CoA ligase YhfT [Clostridium saccharobutylicum]NSB91041.1 long-chain acyl-CoA synthetase [Clostridium saccharobutylicum]NYC31688.1 long-chain acyl-CoA synthetase [Clostridium saccharobutylicum]OOM13143.1 putative acyl--CoA ligase YhfT [Clostridium saccharobutylicum]
MSMNYFKLLKKIQKENSEKSFLIVDGKFYTYEDVYKKTRLFIDVLKNIQVINEENTNESCKKTVLIYSDDFYFQIISFFAINGTHAIPIIAHHNLPHEVLNKIIINNNINYVLSNKEISGISEDGFVKEILLHKKLNYKKNGIEYKENIQISKHEVLCNIYVYGPQMLKESINVNSEVCMGVLTSGSTGVPKVLYRTYESWAEFFDIQNNIFKINSNSKLFINGSLSFTGNLNAVMSTLYEGGSIVSLTSFKCKQWIKTFEEMKITNIYLVPSKLRMLTKLVKKRINSVKSIFTGSELLIYAVADRLKQIFPESELILYYGASELNYITYITYKEMYVNPLSVGRPFPNMDVFIKSDFIYVNTKYHVEGMTNPCTVYDAGYIDDNGYLIFKGRKDDIVNKGGIKISCLKIETEINKINGVKENAVIPYADDKKGNEMAAFVVADKQVTRDYIIDNLKSKIMNIEIPKKIIFVKNIPRNCSGKIDKVFINNISALG